MKCHLNADGLISTGQGLLSGNMFIYCLNNPVANKDENGYVCCSAMDGAAGNMSNNVTDWVKKTFGAESSTVSTETKSKKIIPEPSPIVVETGSSKTQIISQRGNSSKPFSVYAQGDVKHPIKSSSAGAKLNVYKFTLEVSLSMDNIGLTGAWTNGNKTDSFGIRANISELKVGFEGATATQWDNKIQTNYVNVSGSTFGIVAVYMLTTTGQNILQTSQGY